MISGISSQNRPQQNNTNFKGAIKFRYDPTSIAQERFGKEFDGKTVGFWGKDMSHRFHEADLERKAVERLKALNIPFIHHNDPNMTLDEFHKFHNFTTMA